MRFLKMKKNWSNFNLFLRVLKKINNISISWQRSINITTMVLYEVELQKYLIALCLFLYIYKYIYIHVCRKHFTLFWIECWLFLEKNFSWYFYFILLEKWLCLTYRTQIFIWFFDKFFLYKFCHMFNKMW